MEPLYTRKLGRSGIEVSQLGMGCWAIGGGWTLPIPGFKSVRQVEENCKAMEFGPLGADQMAEIERILGRAAEKVGG